MSTAELVIAQAIDHFDGNISSHVKREKVIDSAVIVSGDKRLLLLDHEFNSCGDHFQILQRHTARLCRLNQLSTD